MITQKDIQPILEKYDTSKITIGVLGGHSALDVCSGAKKLGYKTLAVCQKGREKTYAKYYKSRDGKGCIDDVILVDKFADVVNDDIQDELRKRNTIFIHNRYFWVYFKDFDLVESQFKVPIYGNRILVKLEERDQPNNQYELLQKANIRIPKIIRKGNSGMTKNELIKALDNHFVMGDDGPLIVKVNEAIRGYERAFFVITKECEYFDTSEQMMEKGLITQEDLDRAVIEEFIIGAQVNFNFFYSPLNGELELLGTDTRRQTSLDGFLRLDATVQTKLINSGYKPKMIETGHVSCTVKESIVEKAFEAGEKFVATLGKEVPPGMIGPFALQGAVSAEHGREELVIFDVSMRIPGSPGTPFTPYSGYLYGNSISYGERIAMEIKDAVESGRLGDILT
jgi:5-formaminoimidazole-4-carboxamide-1-(beta)-D-ribofuranosyl 5'-monophosphate synthetase